MSRIGRLPVAIPAGVTVSLAEGNKVTVKKITSKKATVEISDVVTARKVTKYNTDTTKNQKDCGITTEDVECSVTGIAANALKGNTKAKKVIISSDIKTIGKNAFKGAKNLKTVEIGGPLNSVGKGAFSGINKNATIKIEASKAKFAATKKLIKASGVAKTVKIKRV